MRSMLRASWRKSSSRRSDVGQVLDHGRQVDQLAERRPRRRLLGEQLEQAEVPVDVGAARCGRCTFTTTRPPSSSTRAVHLADRPGRERLGSMSSKTSSHGTPSSCSITATTSASVSGVTRSWSVRELLDELGREQVGPRREDLAELGRTSGRAPRAPRGGARPWPFETGSRSAPAPEQLREAVARPRTRPIWVARPRSWPSTSSGSGAARRLTCLARGDGSACSAGPHRARWSS